MLPAQFPHDIPLVEEIIPSVNDGIGLLAVVYT